MSTWLNQSGLLYSGRVLVNGSPSLAQEPCFALVSNVVSSEEMASVLAGTLAGADIPR